jgi:hypothetical protein
MAPFILADSGAEPGPAYLTDYTIPTSPDKDLRAIVLPNAPVKIVAITLDK